MMKKWVVTVHDLKAIERMKEMRDKNEMGFNGRTNQ